MKQKIASLLKTPFLPLLLCLFALPQCSLPGASSSFLELRSVGETFSPPDEQFMYLDLDLDYYSQEGVEPPLYEINTSEEYGDSEERDSVSNCEIIYDEDEPASQDMICILDMMENDLLLLDGGDESGGTDISLSFNVPEGMCHQLAIKPAWHFNHKSGNGPPYVCVIESNSAGTCSGEIEGDGSCDSNTNKTDCEDDSCEWEGESRYALPDVDGKPSKADCDEITSSGSEDVLELCKDSSYGFVHGTQNDVINCCFGTYDEVGENESSDNEWGGNLQQCIGGPGRTNWDHYDDRGEPVGTIGGILSGNKRDIKISPLISTIAGQSFSTPIANYLDILDQPIKDIRNIEENDLPPFLRFKIIGDHVSIPEPYYNFTCLDGAGEILHRINLLIREWNTYEEFLDFYNSGGEDDNADPNVPAKGQVGAEGEDCDYETRTLLSSRVQKFDRCNDFLDFEDVHANQDLLQSLRDEIPSDEQYRELRDRLDNRSIGYPGDLGLRYE